MIESWIVLGAIQLSGKGVWSIIDKSEKFCENVVSVRQSVAMEATASVSCRVKFPATL